MSTCQHCGAPTWHDGRCYVCRPVDLSDGGSDGRQDWTQPVAPAGEAPPTQPRYGPPPTQPPPTRPAQVPPTQAYQQPGYGPPPVQAGWTPAPPPRRGAGPWLAAVAALLLVALVAGLGVYLVRQGGTPAATDDRQDGTATTEPSAGDDPTVTAEPTPTATEPGADELGIGQPIANVGCTDQWLVVLASHYEPAGYGEVRDAVRATAGAHYLRTDRSCGSFAQSVDGYPGPIYAAYLGPFDTTQEACDARSAAGVGRATLRQVSADVETRDACACYSDAALLPRLGLGSEDAGGGTVAAINDAQWLLAEAVGFPEDDVVGVFGEETRRYVRIFQREQGLASDGRVGPDTWSRLQSEAC